MTKDASLKIIEKLIKELEEKDKRIRELEDRIKELEQQKMTQANAVTPMFERSVTELAKILEKHKKTELSKDSDLQKKIDICVDTILRYAKEKGYQ